MAEVEADPSLHDYNGNDPDPDLITSNTISTNAPLDPFDRLPNELLAHIIFCVVESPLHYSRTKEFDWEDAKGVDSPRLPSSVCRRWRAIAFSTPRLWENIRPKFKGPMEGNYECTLLRQWLERSGQNAISLKIGSHYEKRTVDPSQPVKMYPRYLNYDISEIISSFLHRCRAIYIDPSSRAPDLRDIRNQLANGMPSLRELYSGLLKDVDMDLRSSTHLESVISRYNAFSRFRFDESQFHTMRRLEMEGSVNDLHYLLQHFSSLIECTFRVSCKAAPSIDASIARQPFVRPTLEILVIESKFSYDRRCFYCLWKQFCLPSLKKLMVYFPGLLGREDHDWASFYSFFQQSTPHWRF